MLKAVGQGGASALLHGVVAVQTSASLPRSSKRSSGTVFAQHYKGAVFPRQRWLVPFVGYCITADDVETNLKIGTACTHPRFRSARSPGRHEIGACVCCRIVRVTIMLIRVCAPKVQEHKIRNVRKGIGERLDSRRSNVVAPEPHNSFNSRARAVFEVHERSGLYGPRTKSTRSVCGSEPQNTFNSRIRNERRLRRTKSQHARPKSVGFTSDFTPPSGTRSPWF